MTRILPVGTDALLVELESTAQAGDVYRALRAAVESGTLPTPRDLVPAARTVLVDGLSDRDAVAAVMTAAGSEHRPQGRLVEIDASYDGEDLDEVARQWGCSVSDVVARHAGTEFEVAFTGFAPGFGYLVADSGNWPEVSRRATPRTRVPAGSVALAGPYCGIYPRSTPGGWQLIGRTDVVLFDPARDSPALLQPGDRVRFVEAS